MASLWLARGEGVSIHCARQTGGIVAVFVRLEKAAANTNKSPMAAELLS
jgi:hypothetical protein